MPLTDEEIKYHIDRNEDLKTTRKLYESLWEEIAEYIFPRRTGIGYTPTPGQKQTSKQYDSTAELALNDLAASMHGTLTPTSMMWSSFKLRDSRLNQLKEVMDWSEMTAAWMASARNQSNFRSEIHEVYLDLAGFGQGCLFVEEKPLHYPGFNGLQYKALTNAEYCTSENAEGRVDTLYREFKLTAVALAKRFGLDKLKGKIADSVEQHPFEKFKIMQCTYPCDIEFTPSGKQPFVFYYIFPDDNILIEEGGYWEFPFIVPRWSKASGEDYGRGRGHIALPDVKTLNKAKEFGLKAWAKDLDPPTFETDGGIIGSLKRYPGGRNIARNKDSIWTLERGNARYDVSQIKEEALRQSIRQVFFSDQLNLPDKSEMREMEVAVRYEMMQRILGPALGRFEGEGLNPLIEREFGIMMRASSGKYPVLPPPPDILSRMGINEIDIEYEGPLAKSQRQHEMTRMQRVINLAVGVQPLYPQVFDNFDGDEIIRTAAEIEGMPSQTLNSIEERDAIRAERQKAQAAEQQKQDLERLAAGLKDIAPAGKVLADVMGGKSEAA